MRMRMRTRENKRISLIDMLRVRENENERISSLSLSSRLVDEKGGERDSSHEIISCPTNSRLS
jgi:hypothetical protein